MSAMPPAGNSRPPRETDPDDGIFTEERCRRCGICCGAADGHPCEHLRRDGERYYCEIYGNHLGFHHTVDGIPFRCVTIREVIRHTGGDPECAYVQALRRRERARLR